MYTDLDGLGKSKKGFKKLLQKHPGFKMKEKLLKAHPLMMPLTMMKSAKPSLRGQKKKAASAIAPAVAEPITLSPVEREEYIQVETKPYYPPEYRQPQPYIQMPEYRQKMPMPEYRQPMPQYRDEPSAAILPADYFPTELEFDDSLPDIENVPLITPYESATAAAYGNEEDFSDTREAYETEAGYLQGLGQESGSTGGWFTDLVATGTKAYAEIARAKAAAKAQRAPAPIFQPGAYRPGTTFGGFNMNTAIMLGGIGLAAFFIFRKFPKSKR